ncbi:MAG: hypothetical protein EOO51_12535 [Flavobacterium sp.]|nr:MAG: hypothetical protein EOO51_12535 [Flavobacterium sp.]
MKSIFTIPKVVKYNDLKKSWFVYFRYDGKLFRYKYGINYIQDYNERLKEADALCAALHEKLREGWNPSKTADEIQKENEISKYATMTLKEALTLGMNAKVDISEKTKLDYDCTVRFINTAIDKCGFGTLKASETKRIHIRLILDKAKSINAWSNHSYNKNLSYLSAIIGEVLEFEVMEYNPCAKIKKKSVEKSDKHRPPTPQEFAKIIEALKPHPNFFRYCDAVYQTLCREVELLRLRVNMVDMNNRTITLPAGIIKSRTKSRIIPINDFLYSYFEDMKIQEMPKDYFVFGTRKVPKNSLMYRVEWLTPAPYEIHRNRVTELWKELIKDGQGIDVTLYAMKSAGVDSLLNSGAQLAAISGLAGHASTEMTATYYATVLEKQYRAEVSKHAKKFGSVD